MTGIPMANDGKIHAVHIGLVVRPWRFVVERQIAPTIVRYDRYSPSTLRELMISLFELLNADCHDFAHRLASLDDGNFMGTRQQRRFIAERRDLLYIGSPHLEKHAVQFQDYWVATNVGHKEVRAIAYRACDAAGIKSESLSKLKL
ncbi:MAG: hypothetical protein A3G80_03785 [Betaproteobacteria bacterium RIFCSPLOWO2_12_FULL_62_13b]|nr:MAG: hypothetical protein A3G80_03785 [Betaproteobacteria bacterium RIFCSPLOWO2_12_FULL_62_13b]